MAGIILAETLVKENRSKGIVKSIYEQEDQEERNEKFFEHIIELKDGSNIKLNDYNQDVKCSKHIKEGDSVELKVIGENEAILLKENEIYSEKDRYKTIRKEEDYYIDYSIEKECIELQSEIEERVRKIEKLRDEKIITINTYHGDIEIDGKEAKGAKCLIYFEGDDRPFFDDEEPEYISDED